MRGPMAGAIRTARFVKRAINWTTVASALLSWWSLSWD